MALFRRKSATDGSAATAGRKRARGAVSVSKSGRSGPAESAGPASPAPAAVERYSGTVIEPAATAAHRINSAADVDANVKKYGDEGVFKGGGGGFGGAGTK
jgi:hypothetical protein